MNCVFYSDYLNECVALRVCDPKNCRREICSFYKTKKEYDDSCKRAADRLHDMGLLPYIKTIGGVRIMTVKNMNNGG